jgi:hypothetical protein
MRLPAGLFAPGRDAARDTLDRFVADLKAGRHDAYLAFDPRYARLAVDEQGRCNAAALCRFDAAADAV